MDGKPMQSLDKLRWQINRRVREYRKAHQWTQAQLASALDLSQARLSEIERGDGSFSAEQFITVLKLFNADLTQFVPPSGSPTDELQNALARLGAQHLQENTDALPSERLRELTAVVRESLVLAQPRLVTSIAPVLVSQIDTLNLVQINALLEGAGLRYRFAWIVENTEEAAKRVQPSVSRAWAPNYRRATVAFQNFLESIDPPLPSNASHPMAGFDLLDGTIRSLRTLRQVVDESSPISKRWRIATSIKPEDFEAALRAVHVAG